MLTGTLATWERSWGRPDAERHIGAACRAIIIEVANPLDPLPEAVRRSARVYDNGEVAWPRDEAERAIVAMGQANCLVLGLDFHRDEEDDGLFEMPWSAHDPAGRSTEDVRVATERSINDLRAGLADLDLADFPWVLITWEPLD